MHRRRWRPPIHRQLVVALAVAGIAVATLGGCGPVRTDNAASAGAELTAVTTIDHTIAAGGRAARFRVSVHNGTHSRQRSALLVETPIVGKEPSDLHLDRRQDSSWLPVAVDWNDPDEPEFLRSTRIPVDVRPGTSQSYEFRIGLPGTYTPCRYDDCGAGLDKRSFRLSVALVNLRGNRSGSSPSRSARFRLGPKESPRLTIDPPEGVTLAGAPAEFTVGVDNSSGHAHEPTRLILTLKGAVGGLTAGRTVLELRGRDGTWHRLQVADVEHQPRATIADRMAVPVGYRATYRLCLKLGLGAGEPAENGTELGLLAELDDIGSERTPVALSDAMAETELVTPIVTVDMPSTAGDGSDDAPTVRRPAIGMPYEFSVTIDNRTTATYPPLGVVVEATGTRDLARNLTVRYRADGSSAWLPAPWSQTGGGGVDRVRYRLPPDDGRGAPPGFRKTYQVQLTRKNGTNTGILVEVVVARPETPLYVASGPELYPPSR